MSANAQVAAALHRMGDEANEALEERFYKSLDIVKREASRLARMSDAMIALEVASSGYSEKSELDVGYLFQTTAELYRTLVEHCGNRLVIHIPDVQVQGDGAARVMGNADGLSQVLINLVCNANEHTKNGDITVKMARDARSMTVTVSDTGEGIAPGALQTIFERRPLVGTSGEVGGMGLSICRDIVLNHGGKIWIESEPGVGTSAFFTLPVLRGDDRG
jgi:signal transduction histidine kinase